MESTVTFLIFLIPVGLCGTRIVSKAGIVVCIPGFFHVQRMHTTFPVFRASVALRIYRLADSTPFSGALLKVCHTDDSHLSLVDNC